jgi:eukaryotic-like serine/threonine-protein kinase
VKAEWGRVKRIFEEAIEIDPAGRNAFVAAACGADVKLREAVEELLRHHERSGDVLASRSPEGRSQVPAEGSSIAQFKILTKLGAGAMGEVWKAEDTTLRRMVALKFLAHDVIDDHSARARFMREAQAAATLDHPNVCPVHGIHERGGEIFISMALVEGPTLADKVRERPLPVEEALDIAAQIAAGLQEAHSQGVVHRDIKPRNILINRQGLVKITDFGLAQVAGRSKLTQSGVTLGTPLYMSPEQIEGRLTDRRSDIWSLGVVLYEMVTQRTPFDSEYHQAIAYSIVNERHEPATALRSGLPLEIDRIIGRALAKEPEERYQHVDDMLVDLRRVSRMAASPAAESSPAVVPAQPPAAFPRRRLLYAGLATAGVAAAGAAWRLGGGGRRAAGLQPGAPLRIAVLPLHNLSGEEGQDYFSDGMTDVLISELGRLDLLRVTSWTSVARYKDGRTPLPEIAGDLGVGYIVEGAVLRAGGRVRVSARLIRADQDVQLWTGTQEDREEDVLGLQRRIARQMAGEISARFDAALQAAGGEAPSVDPQAYNAYLQGLQEWNAEQAGRALQQFRIAIERDPSFAQAHAWLAQCYASGGGGTDLSVRRVELGREATRTANLALALDPRSDVAYNALGWVNMFFDYDWDAAERHVRRALELNPSSADGYHRLSHYFGMLGRVQEGVEAADTAVRLNPFSRGMVAHRVWALYMARRFREAVEYAEAILATDPQSRTARNYARAAYLALGDHEKALATADANSADAVHAHVLAGNRTMAEEALEALLERAVQHPNFSYSVAQAYTALDEPDQALTWMEKAYEHRAFPLPEIAVDPLFDPLREEARFVALLENMGLDSVGASEDVIAAAAANYRDERGPNNLARRQA